MEGQGGGDGVQRSCGVSHGCEESLSRSEGTQQA